MGGVIVVALLCILWGRCNGSVVQAQAVLRVLRLIVVLQIRVSCAFEQHIEGRLENHQSIIAKIDGRPKSSLT